MKNYWENPADYEIDTGKNILRYWQSAGKLQICMPKWTDKDGVEKNGNALRSASTLSEKRTAALNWLKRYSRILYFKQEEN